MKALTFTFLLALSLAVSQTTALSQTTSQPAPTTEKAPTLQPGDNLVIENVPRPPLPLVDEVNRYTEFRTAAFSSWHPREKQILISTRFADTKQVHLVKSPAGARTQLTFFRENAVAPIFQPVTGEYFIFGKDKGGDEFYQLYRYDFSDQSITLLTDGKSRNTGPVFSHGGGHVAYGSTRRNGSDVDIYVVAPKNPKSDRMLAQLQGGGWEVLDFSPDDKHILVQEEISVNESYLWIIDSSTGEKRLLTPKGGNEKIYYGRGRFGKDGNIYAPTDKDNEFRRLAFIDITSGKHTYLTDQIKWDVEQIDITDDGKRIAFTTNEDGLSLLHVMDTATGKELPLPRLPAGSVSGPSWHKDNNELGFQLDSARYPTDVYSLSMDSGTIKRWTQSETGSLDTSHFVEPELVKWKSWDGRMISAFLFRPPAKFTGKRPLVINIHGGPEGQSRPGYMGRINYYLNELGVAIVFPNVRGSVGYGKSFALMDNGFGREGSYKDIGALFDWIKERPDLDAGRVMVTGGSYGGFMTLAVATNYDDKIRCSLDVVGPSNLVTFLKNTQAYRRDLRRAEYGDERDPKMNEFLERIAPANHTDKITKPMFVVQGKNDPRVPASESEQMVANVRKHGTPVWFLMANDEGHGFAKKKNIDYQFYSTILFMRQYLLEEK